VSRPKTVVDYQGLSRGATITSIINRKYGRLERDAVNCVEGVAQQLKEYVNDGDS
jgi:hypothetical protein